MRNKNSCLLSMILIMFLVFGPLPVLAEVNAVDTLTFPQVTAGLLLLVTVIGVLYNLWKTTKAYGGLIGQGLRRFGFGIVFLVAEALDRIAVSFGSRDLFSSFIPKYYLSNAHDTLLLLGLLFLAWGFSKLSSAVKN